MLKALIDSLDAVEEGLRGFYEEVTEDSPYKGKFALKVTPVGGMALEDVSGLRNTLTTLKTEKKDLSEKLASFEGIDPKAAKSALKKAEQFDKFDPEKEADKLAQAKFESWKETTLAEVDKKVSDAESVANKWKSRAERMTVTDTITRALNAAGVVTEDADLVADRMARHIQLVEDGDDLVINVVDEKKQPRYGSRGIPFSIEQLALEFREKYPRNFKADVKPGSGSNGSGGSNGYAGKNPFSKKSWNLTEQGKLYKEQPALYERLKAEASAE